MSKLKILVILNQRISTDIIRETISGCPDLELLDIRGCLQVKLDDKLVENFPAALKILGPGQDHYDCYSGMSLSPTIFFLILTEMDFSIFDEIES
ncbi:hypothetical protein L484_019105 [Morus notabilis]|uniref:Uncharacterized protein n=1 Tax=Morus notabilis TaxID=981085 RepID=W9SBC0_9ROSA|nr:hypothetical protein L484_019105 [Morus notabilis]